MYLICGLGNPGNKYVNTRHNIGFKLIDSIFNKYNFKLIKKNKNKELFSGKITNKNCLLIKPQNFMNLSGDVVAVLVVVPSVIDVVASVSCVVIVVVGAMVFIIIFKILIDYKRI